MSRRQGDRLAYEAHPSAGADSRQAGCRKFSKRFGINAKVVQLGAIRVGDVASKRQAIFRITPWLEVVPRLAWNRNTGRRASTVQPGDSWPHAMHCR